MSRSGISFASSSPSSLHSSPLWAPTPLCLAPGRRRRLWFVWHQHHATNPLSGMSCCETHPRCDDFSQHPPCSLSVCGLGSAGDSSAPWVLAGDRVVWGFGVMVYSLVSSGLLDAQTGLSARTPLFLSMQLGPLTASWLDPKCQDEETAHLPGHSIWCPPRPKASHRPAQIQGIQVLLYLRATCAKTPDGA